MNKTELVAAMAKEAEPFQKRCRESCIKVISSML